MKLKFLVDEDIANYKVKHREQLKANRLTDIGFKSWLLEKATIDDISWDEYITKIYGSDKWKKDPALLLNYRLTDKGFLATTPDKSGGFSGQVILYYKTPAKGKGAYIASLSQYSHEKETLFINGTSAIIKEIRTEVLGGRVRYNIYLDME